MYSIIEQGGTQYPVTPGATIEVPLIKAEKGSEVSIDRVLFAAEGDMVRIGTPCVENASAKAVVVDHGKGDKVLVVKKKRRKDYQRKNGHRQQYTKLEILSISVDGTIYEMSALPQEGTAAQPADAVENPATADAGSDSQETKE